MNDFPGFSQRVAADGAEAAFGLNVLDLFLREARRFVDAHPRKGHRRRGSALLACSPWITDPGIIDLTHDFAHACIVTTKRPLHQGEGAADKRMLGRALEGRGLPVRYFSELRNMHIGEADESAAFRAVPPHESLASDLCLETFRRVGRRGAARTWPQMMHAKVALLGELWWSDEGPAGSTEDVWGFTPRQLWLSSANFTMASRRHLEFGIWTRDPALLRSANDFLQALIAISEPLGSEEAAPTPELVEADWNGEALHGYAQESPTAREEDT